MPVGQELTPEQLEAMAEDLHQAVPKCCGTCVYYLADQDRNGVGVCRRYPPTFPFTRLAVWCGEYKLDVGEGEG